jgi:hypothetical protein
MPVASKVSRTPRRLKGVCFVVPRDHWTRMCWTAALPGCVSLPSSAFNSTACGRVAFCRLFQGKGWRSASESRGPPVTGVPINYETKSSRARPSRAVARPRPVSRLPNAHTSSSTPTDSAFQRSSIRFWKSTPARGKASCCRGHLHTSSRREPATTSARVFGLSKRSRTRSAWPA